MKKILALMTALVLLSVSAFGVIGSTVNAEKDQVCFTENILYGDKSAAEGVAVSSRLHYQNHLFWESSYTLGENQSSKTDFDFSQLDRYENESSHYNGISLQLDFWSSSIDYEEIPIEQLTGVPKAYRELYDETAPGEERSKQIRLKDYYDYYPIAFTISLPGEGWTDYDYLRYNGANSEEAKRQVALFNEFFKIPVLDSDTLGLSVSKPDGSGDPSTTRGLDWFGTYRTDSRSAYTSDKCYFSIVNRKDNGEKIDTSLIPGGYGIYAFAYDSATDDGKSKLYADTLETVFPLDEDVYVLHLSANSEQDRLLLFTSEQGATYLTVIDIETMKTVQKVQLFEDAIDSLSYVWVYKDFLVLQRPKNQLSVVALNDDGKYEFKFTTPVESHYSYFMNYDVAIDFDGNRLVIADQLYDTQPGDDFYVAIFDSSGQIFYAEYTSSLSSNYDYDHCEFFGSNPISVNCQPNRKDAPPEG